MTFQTFALRGMKIAARRLSHRSKDELSGAFVFKALSLEAFTSMCRWSRARVFH